jgi:hypothetical protein
MDERIEERWELRLDGRCVGSSTNRFESAPPAEFYAACDS